MSRIGIDPNNINERAASLKQASENLGEQALSPIDSRSTISANENTKKAFEHAQSAHQILGTALLQSSQTIKDIGEGFFTLDEQAATSFASN